jgi:D-xylose transport system substrate-binding protein
VHRPARRLALAVPTLAAALALSACASSSTKTTSTSSSPAAAPSAGATTAAPSGTIALLLPEVATTRYEAFDKPYFEEALKTQCPDCKLVYSNANQSEAQQLQQANAALAQGAKVLVLDPVNGATAGRIVSAAKAKGVPVISYDRLITGGGAKPDYYISFDNEKVGVLQATELKKQLDAKGKNGNIVWINGSPTDNNATLFAKGAHTVIPKDGIDGYKVGYEIATPDWVPATAKQEMQAAIAKLGVGSIVGVYSANDGMATTISSVLPEGIPLTGQDAEKLAITRILTGKQSMTVYKAIKPEAAGAAELAVALLKGTTPTTVAGVSVSTSAAVNNVPSVLLEPVAVTKDNVKDTVIADGFYKASDVCTGAAKAVCTALGIS